jgi:hypothetical protein
MYDEVTLLNISHEDDDKKTFEPVELFMIKVSTRSDISGLDFSDLKQITTRVAYSDNYTYENIITSRLKTFIKGVKDSLPTSIKDNVNIIVDIIEVTKLNTQTTTDGVTPIIKYTESTDVERFIKLKKCKIIDYINTDSRILFTTSNLALNNIIFLSRVKQNDVKKDEYYTKEDEVMEHIIEYIEDCAGADIKLEREENDNYSLRPQPTTLVNASETTKRNKQQALGKKAVGFGDVQYTKGGKYKSKKRLRKTKKQKRKTRKNKKTKRKRKSNKRKTRKRH